jgi:hypothetical protein
MRLFILLLLFLNSKAQVSLWTRLAGTGFGEYAQGVSNDGSGNIYVVGTAVAITDGESYAGGGDVLLMKYSSDGTKLWTRITGNSAAEYAFAVSADSFGSIYVAGYTYGSTLNSQNSNGGVDSFVIQYSSDGTRGWTRLAGTSGDDYAVSVSADNSGNVYLAGNAPDSMDGETYVGGTDIFLVKYQYNGNRAWTRMWGSGSLDYADAVTVDNLGNVYVAGRTFGSLDSETNIGPPDALLIKCTSDGTKQWIRLFGSSALDYSNGVAADILGNIYVTGHTEGAFPGQSFYGGTRDIFLVKYLANGTKAWMRQSGTATDDYGYSVSVDNTGNVYVTGSTGASLDGQTYSNLDDFFLMKYNSNGDKLWTRQFGTSSQDIAYGVSASGSEVYVAGSTGGALNGESKPGGQDIFLMSYLDGTSSPSTEPSASPTDAPSDSPTASPSDAPSVEPSAAPSAPSASPTDVPSDSPTAEPSTFEPSASPSAAPSASPSAAPSPSPTSKPSVSPTARPSSAGVPSLPPSTSIEGSWCVRFGLFDTFGDGWGEGAVLRIYNQNDPSIFMDLTNLDRSFVESYICLNPSLSLFAEVICDDCALQEPWEMYYSISVRSGRSREAFYGAYDTVMSFQNQKVRMRSNSINYNDRVWSCKEECDRPRLGSGNADRVFDMTGDGKFGGCINSAIPYFFFTFQVGARRVILSLRRPATTHRAEDLWGTR